MKLYLYNPVMGSIPSEALKKTRGTTTQPKKEITGRLKMREQQTKHKKLWALKKNHIGYILDPVQQSILAYTRFIQLLQYSS